MTVRYFSPTFKMALSTRWAERYGRDAWDHLIGCLNAHETADSEVRHFGEFALKPYSLEMARALAELGKNVRKPRPWE
jgi:hypothetical protein